MGYDVWDMCNLKNARRSVWERGRCIFGAFFLDTKKTYKVENQFLVGLLLRRALDSNQRIPYDIGSLANCWFKPLTQPSLNHLFIKRAMQIYN